VKRHGRLLLALLLLLALAIPLALASGSQGVGERLLSGTLDPLTSRILFDLRLPRVIAAVAVGGLLALAGALLQLLLRNPLADPYILGISGGASSGALLAILAGVSGLWQAGGAFFGALCSILLVFTLSHGQGSWNTTRLLLTGVVLAAGWGALISLLLTLAPQGAVHGMLFWLMGDLSHARAPWAALAAVVLATLLITPLGRPLNLLARGETQATLLGVEVGPLRTLIYFLASLLTAMAVTLGGSIGFIGLVTPHLLRLAGVHDHRWLLPCSALLGALLLLAADTLARVAIAPQQLPVGVLTALLGVPLFLYLLARGGERG